MTEQAEAAREWVLVEREHLNELLQWAQYQSVGPVLKDVQLRLERQLTCEPPDWWFTEEPEPRRSLWRRVLVVVVALVVLVASGAVWAAVHV